MGRLGDFFKRTKFAALGPGFGSLFMGGASPDQLPGPMDFQAQVEMGFRRNAVIQACIRRLSRSASEPAIQAVTVMPDGQFRTDMRPDPLAKLLCEPNEVQDSCEFFEQLLIHLYVAGNAFVYKVRSKIGGPPQQIELIRPDLMGIIAGKNRQEGRIKAYTVRTDDGGKKEVIPKEDIIHFRLPDAFNEYWGLSPLYTVARYGDIDLQSADFLRAFFKNRGIPSGLLTFAGNMVKAERERVKELWNEQFQGIQGWHNIAVLDANVTYSPLSTGLQSMNLDPITTQTESRICMVFGVPPLLVGSMVGANRGEFANIDVVERIFWTDTLMPIFTRLGKKMTRGLAEAEYGDNRAVMFDMSNVAALTESKSETRKVAIQGWRAGLLTRNQADRMLAQGLDHADPNGDVYLMNSNQQLVPIGQMPVPQGTVGDQPSTTVGI